MDFFVLIPNWLLKYMVLGGVFIVVFVIIPLAFLGLAFEYWYVSVPLLLLGAGVLFRGIQRWRAEERLRQEEQLRLEAEAAQRRLERRERSLGEQAALAARATGRGTKAAATATGRATARAGRGGAELVKSVGPRSQKLREARERRRAEKVQRDREKVSEAQRRGLLDGNDRQ